MIVKRNGGYAVIHCHGAKKGQTIKQFRTNAEALAMHRAIEASKHSPFRAARKR